VTASTAQPPNKIFCLAQNGGGERKLAEAAVVVTGTGGAQSSIAR